MILALAAALPSCGQKGPLVLPTVPVVPAAPAAAEPVTFPGVPATTEKR
jgi:predicted small lipoprotein YifL